MHLCVIWSRPRCCMKKKRKKKKPGSLRDQQTPRPTSSWRQDGKAPPQKTTHHKHILFIKQNVSPSSTLSPEPKQKCLSLLFGSIKPRYLRLFVNINSDETEGKRWRWVRARGAAGRGRRRKGGEKINLILQNYQIIWNYGFLVWAFSPCLPSCANQFKQTQRANTRWTPQ